MCPSQSWELTHTSLSLSAPLYCSPCCFPRGDSEGQEIFTLEILSLWLAMLPVYITPRCKNTKRRLESGAVYLYWPHAACVFLIFKERSQGKVCLNLAVHEGSRELRGQPFHFPKPPFPRQKQLSALTCSFSVTPSSCVRLHFDCRTPKKLQEWERVRTPGC